MPTEGACGGLSSHVVVSRALDIETPKIMGPFFNGTQEMDPRSLDAATYQMPRPRGTPIESTSRAEIDHVRVQGPSGNDCLRAPWVSAQSVTSFFWG